jgi:glycosyltransferase involved in cell wall biosynthesis
LAAALSINVPIFGRRIDQWIAVSNYVARQHAGLPDATRRVQVIPPLVDLPESSPDPPDQPPYVLYVGPGEENPDKGRATLLEAFERQSLDPYRLMLVGGRERLSAGHLDDRGYLKGDDLTRAFRGATFTVVPSRWPDPCPAVAVEALANGRPVIASKVGGLAEIVDEGKTGLLVPPNDPVALSAALQRLGADHRLREVMSRAARSSVARFATENVLSQHEELYRQVIEAAPCIRTRGACEG